MSGTVSYDLFTERLGSNSGFTAEGGFYQTFINNTGLSEKGTIVVASDSIDNAVEIAPASSQMPMGVIYESGIANGSLVKVVIYGRAQVLLKDGEAAFQGHWAGVSNIAGRMYQLLSPPILTLAAHNTKIGNSLEETGSGTDVLSFVQIQFA